MPNTLYKSQQHHPLELILTAGSGPGPFRTNMLSAGADRGLTHTSAHTHTQSHMQLCGSTSVAQMLHAHSVCFNRVSEMVTNTRPCTGNPESLQHLCATDTFTRQTPPGSDLGLWGRICMVSPGSQDRTQLRCAPHSWGLRCHSNTRTAGEGTV